MKWTEATEAYLNGEKLEGLSSRQAKRNDPSGNVAKSKRGSSFGMKEDSLWRRNYVLPFTFANLLGQNLCIVGT